MYRCWEAIGTNRKLWHRWKCTNRYLGISSCGSNALQLKLTVGAICLLPNNGRALQLPKILEGNVQFSNSIYMLSIVNSNKHRERLFANYQSIRAICFIIYLFISATPLWSHLINIWFSKDSSKNTIKCL